MCDCSAREGQPVPQQNALRITGAIVVLLSFIEFIVGGVVYSTMTLPRIGAWWGAILPFIAGICAIVSQNRSYVIGACVCASVGIVVSFAAAITDGIGSTIVNSLDTCVSDKGQVYGSKSGESYSNAGSCYIDAFDDNFGHSCYCNNGDSICYFYDLADSSDTCNVVLTTYASNLAGSAALSSLILIGVFILSIISCISVCAPPPASSGGDGAPQAATATVVTTNKA